MKVGNFIKTNQYSYSSKDKWEYIYYLDTGNITENRIDEIVKLNPLTDKIPSRAKRKVKKGNIIYSTVRPNQKHYGYVDKQYDNLLVSTGFVVIDVNEDIADGKYFYYWLTQEKNTNYLQTIAENTVATYPSIAPKDIENMSIELPLLDIQRKIAKVLSNYDDLIENNNKRIKILEEMAQKIYKEWFVDFKYPGHETVTFKDTELGKIPSDWHIGCIKELNNVQGGYAFKSTDLKEFGEYGVIKIKNIQAGTVDISFCQHVDMINTKKYEKFKLSAGDLLVALTGAQVGKVGIMPYSKKIFYLNQRVGKFIPNNDFIKNNQYVLMYVSSDKFAAQVNNIASGAAQPNISTSQIENIPMIVASDPMIALYEDKVDSICKEIQVIKTQNAILQETRNILLPRFMSGEIDVENMEVV